MIEKKSKKTAHDLLDFIQAGPTAAHATAEAERRLQVRGFKELRENDRWVLKPGGSFYVKRLHSAIIAVRLGDRPPSEAGFRIIGAHTDSPGFRLKPRALYSKAGYLQAGVEIYGGPILATWTDRDLALAGKVILRGKGGKLETRLICLKEPVLRISLLPIHFNREVNEQGLMLHKQEHLAPVIGLAGDNPPEDIETLLASRLRMRREAIADWELELYDLQPGRLAGLEHELVISSKLDNLGMCHAALSALLESGKSGNAACIAVLFDSEEVGNVTLNGAASNFLRDVLRRINLHLSKREEDRFRSFSRSLFISADQAHAVNPNYQDKYEKEHHCFMNRGPVIKINAQRKYATTAETSAYFAELCRKAGVPFQKFVNRTDMVGGSTIGPVTSASLGMPTVDVGNAILSMHSIREAGGTLDQEMMTAAFREFYSNA